MDLFGNRILPISITVHTILQIVRFWQSSYIHQPHQPLFSCVETTPNFDIPIHQKPSDRLQLLIHHGLQQLPVDIEETMLHCSTPTPWGVLSETKTSTNRSTPSHVRMVLRNFVWSACLANSFWIVAEFTHQETCLLTFLFAELRRVTAVVGTPLSWIRSTI